MTLQYFRDNYTTIDDLVDFINDNELYSRNDDLFFFDEYYLDDSVKDDVSNCDYDWRVLRDYLADIPTGYDYYYRGDEGWFDYHGVTDDDFEWIAGEIENVMDGEWDEDEEEESDDADVEIDNIEDDEWDDCSEEDLQATLQGLFAQFQTICERENRDEEEARAMIDQTLTFNCVELPF